jgi:tetratricopeptide (TPR) repeat protein
LEFVGQSQEASRKGNDQYYQIIQEGMASLCYWLLGRWKDAKANLKKFLIVTNKANDFANYTSGLVNFGHAEFVGGRYKEARKHYLEAVRVCTEENLMGNLKVAYEYLGELAIVEGRFTEAEDYLNKAGEIGERVSPYGTIMTQRWRLMGDLHNAKGEPSEALKAYETCESYLIKLPEELERGACFVGRGVAYAKLEQWKVSRDCFEKALDVFDQCENEWETAKAVVTAVEAGAYSAKQVALQLVTAKELFQRLEHPPWEKRVDQLLSRSDAGPLSRASLRFEKANLERERVLEAMNKSGGNKTKAAELLGIPRTTLLSILRRFEINL